MHIKSIIPATLIAVSIVVAGFALRSGIVTFKDRDRQVSVKGLAEKEVKADKVTWSLVYKELGNDPTEMYKILQQKNQTVVRFLKEGGLKDAEISVNPPAVTDREANDYNSTPTPFGPWNLCAERESRSIFCSATFTGTCPTACTASVWKITPFSRQISPISAIG